MKKILITGGSGLLGSNLALRLRKNYEVLILLNKTKIHIPSTINAKAQSSLDEIFSFFRPDLVINTVAQTNIEICEEDPFLAKEANLNYLKIIVPLCKNNGCKLLHISTDHLSNGLKPFLQEDEDVKPLNVYARTKLEGEKYIQKEMPSALIVRTNFFGWGPKYRNSFSDTIINRIKEKKNISLFEDAFFSPVSMRRLCEVIMLLNSFNAYGIYNVSSNDRISKLQFGLMVCEFFKLDKSFIKISKISENKNLIIRPKDTSLKNKKVSDLLRFNCGLVSENINDLFHDIKDGIKDQIVKL